MKVLLAADFSPPAPGGLQAHLRRLGRALVTNGHEVMVVSGEPADAGGATGGRDAAGGGAGAPLTVRRASPGLDGVPLVSCGPRGAAHPPWPEPAFRHALATALRDFDADVVHAHGWCAHSAVAAAGSRPVVVTLHDYGLRCPTKTMLRGGAECADGRGLRCAVCPGAARGPVTRLALGAALAATTPRLVAGVARFLAVSRHVADRHREVWPDGDIEIIPNFIDPPAEGYTEPDSDTLLFVGPTDRHKGLTVLLGARGFLLPEYARTVVVGTPGDVPGSHPQVEFTGRLAGAALRRRYRDAAVVVVPPIWPEPCPTVVLEALAAGRPVGGSRTGGLPDLVTPGVTGLLVPPADPRALAEALGGLLADRPRLLAMAAAAHHSAAAFHTSAVVPRIEAVYDAAMHEAAVSQATP